MSTELPLSLRERWIVFTLAILTIIGHFINLGLMPLHGDEAIRATVAFEMMQRENYIVPTLWGEYYYKKPPFYNWVLIGFFELFGSFSEFVFRLPSVIPHMLFGATIWAVSRKHIGERAAILAAFGFVLSGRLLTRDSMLGHIDILYSLFTFLGFYVVWHYWRKSSYLKLFLVSYLLAAIGVLMKGLPSFLFQGLTLLAWFVYKKDFKRLYSPSHFAGIALFVLIVGGYFFLYSKYNSLHDYFLDLYDQSSQRTVLERSWYESVIKFFAFPFENFGHLFPTSLFLLFVFRKGTIKKWLSNDFTAFLLITLAINILPYWLSPGYRPRYIFMLYPLAFILGAQMFYLQGFRMPKLSKGVFGVFLAIGIFLTTAFISVFFLKEVRELTAVVPASAILLLCTSVVIWLWFKLPGQRVYWSLIFLALFRLGFDFVVIPYRVFVENGPHVQRRKHSENIIAITGDKPLQVLDGTPLYLEYSYYLAVGKDTIMYDRTVPEPGVFYLALPHMNEEHALEEFYQFHLGYRDYDIVLLKMKE